MYVYNVCLIQRSEQTTLRLRQKCCSIQQDNIGSLRTLENTNLPQKRIKQAYKSRDQTEVAHTPGCLVFCA
jgi:hypothetical protein